MALHQHTQWLSKSVFGVGEVKKDIPEELALKLDLNVQMRSLCVESLRLAAVLAMWLFLCLFSLTHLSQLR